MFTENVFEETLNLYKNSKSKSIALQCIQNFLSNEAFQKSFVAYINKLLGVSSSRLDGLQLVIECIENITPDVLSDQGPYWVKCCLTNYEHSQNKELNLRTLKSIIIWSNGQTDFSRKLATEYVIPILDILLNGDTDLFIRTSAIECLSACLKYYSSYCKQHKKKIEDYLLGYLESFSDQLVTESVKAFVCCQKIPTCGNTGLSSINNVSISFRRLCITCHYLLDDIFEQCLEIENFEVDGIEPFIIKGPPSHSNSQLKLQHKTQIILNILEWLTMFISEEASFTVHSDIFSLFERGLSLHKCSKEDSVEAKYLSFNLLQIQTKILKVLSELIARLKKKIYPYYLEILNLMRDLSKNKNCDCYIGCSLFQEYSHQILLNLLSMVGHGLDKSLQNTLVTQIIKYNSPIQNGSTVKLQANMVGKSSKTKQKMMLNSIIHKNNRIAKDTAWTNAKLESCVSSLEGLLILVKYNVIDTDVLKKITCFLIENIQCLQKGNMKAPFNKIQCQEILYKTLCSVCEHENPYICWNYGKMIKTVLDNGRKHENLNISSVCREGLRNFEKIFIAFMYARNDYVNENSNASGNFEISENGITNEENIDSNIGCENEMEILDKTEINILENDLLVPAKTELTIEQLHTSKEENVDMENSIAETNIVFLEKDENSFDDQKAEDILIEKDESSTVELEEDSQTEPSPKKIKMEENVADLFANVFNEDYE